MKKYTLVILAFGIPLMSAAAVAGTVNPSVVKLANQVCSLCHGVGGRSIAPTFPLLAGQTAPYTEAQLNAFKNQTRKDPDAEAFMWGMASQLDQDTIKGLAAFYSMQKASPSRKGDPALTATGRTIYYQGIASAKIPPCVTCHGQDAQGKGEFPRLAGQHAAYLVKQLQAFSTDLRSSPIMQPVTRGLTDDDMLAVATFLNAE